MGKRLENLKRLKRAYSHTADHAADSEVHQPANTQTFAATPADDTPPPSEAVDPMDALRVRASKGTKRVKLDDRRRRQTYWLSDREIEMVEEIARAAGQRKYEVVAGAIRSAHQRVFNTAPSGEPEDQGQVP